VKTPRDIHGSDAVKALRCPGFERLRQTGSHHVIRKEGRAVVVPMHKPIKPGTQRGLLEQADLSLEAFIEVLWRVFIGIEQGAGEDRGSPGNGAYLSAARLLECPLGRSSNFR
jgi:predicted RNA binding protein YcfA (HicA-like mRNA interferase family)